jgi:CDP-diacylglycerol---glycerol-3-phosphate 3-phosphatidyltransferase
MASVYDLKPRFVAALRPVAGRLAAAGISANQVTLAAAALSCGLGLLLALFPEVRALWLAVPAFLFLRMALNAIDGILAREHAMKSPLGAILNELGDVISDTALYLPFALLPEASGIWVVLAVILAAISEMAGVVAIQIGAARRYDGPMGKSDRALTFGCLALLVGIGYRMDYWFDVTIVVTIVMLVATIANRCRHALRAAAAGETGAV